MRPLLSHALYFADIAAHWLGMRSLDLYAACMARSTRGDRWGV